MAEVTQQFLEDQGYTHVRQMENGEWIGVSRFIYTYGLCIGLDQFGYARRYCYEFSIHAIIAAKEYKGEGDPSGPWIKQKGEGIERLGPGVKNDT